MKFIKFTSFVLAFGLLSNSALAVRPGTLASKLLNKVQDVVKNPSSYVEDGQLGQDFCNGDESNLRESMESYKLFELEFLQPEDFQMSLNNTYNPYNELYRQELSEIESAFDDLMGVIYKEARKCNGKSFSALKEKYIEYADSNIYKEKYGKEAKEKEVSLYHLRMDAEKDPAYRDLLSSQAEGGCQGSCSAVKSPQDPKAAKEWTENVDKNFKEIRKKQNEIIKKVFNASFEPEDFEPADSRKLWDEGKFPTEPVFFWQQFKDKATNKTLQEYFVLKSFCAGNLQEPECQKFCTEHMQAKDKTKTFCVTTEEYITSKGDSENKEFQKTLSLDQDDQVTYDYDKARAKKRGRYYDLFLNAGLVSQYTLAERNRTIVKILNRTNYDKKPEGGFLVRKTEAVKKLAKSQCPNRQCKKAEDQAKKEKPEEEQTPEEQPDEEVPADGPSGSDEMSSSDGLDSTSSSDSFWDSEVSGVNTDAGGVDYTSDEFSGDAGSTMTPNESF